MIEIDRTQLLQTLDQRHDDLMRQLDELNECIEHALAGSGAATRPADTTATMSQATTI